MENKEERPKRPRIKTIEERMAGAIIPKNDEAFIENKASKNCRKAEEINYKIVLDIWHEKHYHGRHQSGEDDGTKRDGIEPEKVRNAILQGLRHLIYYASTNKEFAFLNDVPEGKRNSRVVIKDMYNYENILNVAVEIHFCDFHRYEITVWTAMMVDKFKIEDGQYILSLTGEYESKLERLIKGSIKTIDTRQT